MLNSCISFSGKKTTNLGEDFSTDFLFWIFVWPFLDLSWTILLKRKKRKQTITQKRYQSKQIKKNFQKNYQKAFSTKKSKKMLNLFFQGTHQIRCRLMHSIPNQIIYLFFNGPEGRKWAKTVPWRPVTLIGNFRGYGNLM